MHGASPARRDGLAPTGTALSTARGDSPKAIPARASRQGRSESAAPSLGSGYVVPTLQAVLWAAPTPGTARLDFGRALYEPVERLRSPCRVSRGARWSCPRMPSLLPRRAPGDRAAVVAIGAPVFLPRQRSRRPH
jgi:hypothetical protein